MSIVLKKAWDKIIREGYRYMKNAVLEDVVTDDNFFASYPELASMPVKIVANGASLARYDSRNKRVVIDRNLFLSPYAARQMSGALQNVIQDYEGFSKAVSLRMLSLEGNVASLEGLIAEELSEATESALIIAVSN